MPEPLEGITVVEMTVAVQGPAAALYLRDMGAQVIKVEPPLGDASRYGRGRQNETPDGTMGPQFVATNRGKRSVCVDLTTEAGSRVIHALLNEADVFLTNYRQPALDKMGLSYEQLKQQYPALIYASVNGFGPKGPDRDKAMIDGVASSRGGLVHHTGYADREASLPGAIVIDTAGAMQLALGVMTALFARERHGCGQQVQTSALGATLWLQQWELTHVGVTGARLGRDGNHHPNIRSFYGIYRTRDNGEIMLAQVMEQEAWDSFCIFAETWDLAIDPRFQTPGQRLGEGISEEDSVEIRSILKVAFATKTTQEWVEFFYTQPEIIWERLRSWNEVLEDEQSIANDYITTVNVNGAGNVRTVGNLVTMSETPGSVKGDPPELGEANEELLSPLGFSETELSEIESTATRVREETLAELMAYAETATSQDQ
ncbi:MAG: CoA transferase [Gammaproteobacteria bacterium]|jgi:CoA:oxalate CoA-transferase|nr:CoA transferase [Gammaproteobacteria bacterium]